MSGFKDVMKGGWHPKGKGEGGKESFRSDFKGVNTVAGWVGKGKGSPSEQYENHQSAPLSTLKDPASFGPPPKHVHYHGAAAAGQSNASQDTGGLGAPVSRDGSTAKERMQARREAEARAEEEANKPPPGPYRANTTGIDTSNLPKPPQFRPGQPASPVAASGTRAPPPRLPPRLPPRQNSHPDLHAPPPPPSYDESVSNAPAPERGILNQGAMNRLGNAGVSIPGLGIGRASPPVPPRQNSTSSNNAVSPPPEPSGPVANKGPQLNELQSRFSKLSTTQSDRPPPAQGTSWAEKQAALKTASNFRNDPSKVSLADMRSAASTANNFRERHGEQAAAGMRTANGLNQKYGIADRVNGLASPTSPAAESSTPAQSAAAKKPPPPPPPKKRGLAGNATANANTNAGASADADAEVNPNAPPPIPLASKPRF